MGACATKPKVVKDDAQTPKPAPEQPVTEATVAGDDVAEDKEKEVLVERELEVGDDKRQSLSSLLKENEIVQEFAKDVSEKAPVAVEDEALKEKTFESEIKAVEEPPVAKPAEDPLPAEESKEVAVEQPREAEIEPTPAAEAKEELLVSEDPHEKLDIAPVEPKPESPAVEIPHLPVEAEAKREVAAEKKTEESK